MPAADNETAPTLPRSAHPVPAQSQFRRTEKAMFMGQWRKPFSTTLKARFRWAAFLMLLPMLALAAVSAAGLLVSTNAASALVEAKTFGDEVQRVDVEVQSFGLAALTVLVGAQSTPIDVAALAHAERTVNTDVTALGLASRPSPDEALLLKPIVDAWKSSLVDRTAIHALGEAATRDPGDTSILEDHLSADITLISSRISALEDAGVLRVASLHGEHDAAVRVSGLTLVVALVLGLAVAALLSGRLARSILTPVTVLRDATLRLASGELHHRVTTTGNDELAQLGGAFNDMSQELEDQRQAVQSREHRLTALVENVNDGILVVAADGVIVFLTPSFRIYMESDDVENAQLGALVHPDDLDRIRAAWIRALGNGQDAPVEVEARLRRRDGVWRHVWASMTNRFDDPAVGGMVLNVSDVSDRHEFEQQLTFQALHDGLTGLPNRELFRQRLDRVAAAAAKNGSNSVLFLDFDDFKRVNDTLGHQAGDTFLVAMAERLLDSIRPQDIVARIGGDEFAILLEGADTRAAVAATQRVLKSLEMTLTIDAKEIEPRASIGIASAVSGTASPETLLADADLAMYFAKRQGKARYEVFSTAMRSDLVDRLQLGEELRSAIEAGGIEVHYQPIVDMESASIVGAEALARWNHPTRGWVGPAVFIPLAEELNLAEQIDASVLRQACLQGKAWADAGLSALRMSVNLSGTNLENPDLARSVAATLRETGFLAANLELELTEGVAIAESEHARTILDSLKALGLHLAIDDFGTGYSALSRLRRLPFDTLKVDKVFVDELAALSPGSTLAESILDMARVLGLKVVAEGVETAVQADFLRKRGCDLAQGYLFSRPLHSADFERLLAAGSVSPAGAEAAALA